jgi:hypothetical protein
MTIYGGFGGLDVMRRPSFHFDKTEDVSLPPDKIEFAAMMWRAVVARDNGVTSPAQVEVSVFLAAPPGTLVRGHILRRKRAGCQPV